MRRGNRIYLVTVAMLAILLGVAIQRSESRAPSTANSVIVTVYFGGQARATLEKGVAHREGLSAIEALAAAAKTEMNAERTFVKSIEGVANSDAHKEYWLYFVNGEPMHVGAAETKLKPGDRVLWFLRRASSTTHQPEKSS